MNPRHYKSFSFVLAVVVCLQNSILAYALETNFWENRSQKTTQVVALPQSLSPFSPADPQSLLRDLPKVKPALGSDEVWKKVSQSSSKEKVQPSFQKILETIPLQFGRIQEVYISPQKQSPAVVLIQDVHLNVEAQSNSIEIVQGLINSDLVGMVGVEGAFGPFDFSPYRAYKNKK